MRIAKESAELLLIKDNNFLAFGIGGLFLLGGLVAIIKPDIFSDQLPIWMALIGVAFGGVVIGSAKMTTATS